MDVTVINENSVEVSIDPPETIVIEVDQGKAGRGIVSVTYEPDGSVYYLEITYTDGTTEQVGPIPVDEPATLVNYYIKASAAITKGDLVMFTGAVGGSGVLQGAPASASLAEGLLVMGIASETIALNGFGYVTSFGLVSGIDTTGSAVGETWADGDILYYNPNYVGKLTKVRPTSPAEVVVVAAVIKSNAGNGTLFIRVSFYPKFAELSDVYAPSPANNDLIQWNSANNRWQSTTNPTISGPTVISVNSSSNALRITQTGTGNALVVEDSANPDATPFVVNANGNVIVGATSSLSGYGYTPSVQNYGSTVSASSLLLQCTASAAAYPILTMGNASSSNNGVVAINQILGQIRFYGGDGAIPLRSAQISAEVDGTPGTNDMPGRLVFSTAADGASSPNERVRINSAGLTTVGFSAATGAALSTTVAAKLYSSNTTYTDGTTAASGTVSHGTIASFDNPAIAATNATVTYTNASTVYIDGAPTAGSNVTITNPYALYVAAGGVYFGGTVSAADPIVQQSDIGTAPNEIPLNQYLGEMAYMNAESVVIQPQASAVPNGIGDMVFQLTSDTSLEIKVKGSDGTVRSVTLTLA